MRIGTLLLMVFCSYSLAVDTLPLRKSVGSGGSPVDPALRSGPQGAPAAAGEGVEPLPQPYVAAVDTYGSPRLDEAKLKALLGTELDEWLTRGMKADPSSVQLERKLADKVKRQFDLAAADWDIVQYFEPGNFAIYITLSVVEKADAAERMRFLAEPTRQFADPEGLIKAWNEYEEIALEMVDNGQLEPESEECPAYHCPFGHKNARLKKYEKIFLDGAKKHHAALVEILAKDKRADFRAAAAYLLAYWKEGNRVIAALGERVRDSDPLVRNNVLRVLGDIAEFHPEFIIPVAPVMEALKFPRVSDRSKAAYVVYMMVLNSQQAREQVLRAGVPQLLDFLDSKQPDHKEIAHGILRKLSGKDFASTDVVSWKSWYGKQAKERALSRR